MNRAAFSVCVVLSLSLVARADNWPAWRGPDGLGHSKERNLPLTWDGTKGENILWKVPLPDQGNSTPIVWGERIFLTQATDKGRQRWVMCLDRKDGRTLWKKSIAYEAKERTHQTNPHCASSPTTDGERVIAWHGSAGMVCYDMDGKELWRRDLGKTDHIWGFAASPVLYGDLVILNFGPGPRQFLVALNKRTGEDVWKADEPGGSTSEEGGYIGTWSTPVIAKIRDRDQLIMSWPDNIKAYDPKTGELIWMCKGLARKDRHRLVYTSPLVREDIVVVMGGFYGPSLAVRPDGKGDVTATHKLWSEPRADQRIGSGLIIDDYIYMVNENSIQCIDLKTGKSRWSRDEEKVWSSLVRASDRIYVTTKDGETVVLAAKPKYEELARNPLPKETTHASIVPADGRFYIRTYKHLWCIGKK